MTKTVKSLLFSVALTLCTIVGSPGAMADSCPNAALRTGPSAALPDCRAYELVTTDLAHASLGFVPSGQALADGNTVEYQTIDAPSHAASAGVFIAVRSTRDATKGWSGEALSGRIPAPVTIYNSYSTYAVAPDLRASFEYSDQPLVSGSIPTGLNGFVRTDDGTYRLLTTAGSEFLPFLDVYSAYPQFVWGNEHFSTVYFQPDRPQLESDPTLGFNTYAWSEEKGLRLVGILPEGQPAPGGASLAVGLLQPGSEDGRYALFNAEGNLYLRIDDVHTATPAASRRTVEPDPNPAPQPGAAGITPDGSKIFFTSRSELTNDANTGSSGGVATDAGNDLYRYDTGTGELTDLTVDANPADAATGANVRDVVQATHDGSYIYFTATGALAPGAAAGHLSLYAWHEGQIDFVANADHMLTSTTNPEGASYVTPDGQHIAFESSGSLTGYDSTDPSSGLPHTEVFEATLGGGIVCASCRTDGTRPIADGRLPVYHGLAQVPHLRDVSDDGSRVFFQSRDAVVAQASSGLQTIFEYANGKAWPISPVRGSTEATLLDASATGDDVFFSTHDTLVSNPNAGDDAVYDARVYGGFASSSATRCSGSACHSEPAPPPVLVSAGSVSFSGPGDVTSGSPPAPAAKRVTVSRVKTILGSSGSLRVTVPGPGSLRVFGADLQSRQSRSSGAQTLTAKLVLTRKASRTLRLRRSLKTKVEVAFVPPGGRAISATVTLTFKTVSIAKGR
jgi:WD40 repeat protein